MYYSAVITSGAQECLKYSVHIYCSSGGGRTDRILQVRYVRHFVYCTSERCLDAQLNVP